MSTHERKHSFWGTTAFIAGALVLWVGAFVLVYVFTAIACAKHFAAMRVLGLPVLPLVTTLICVGAAVVTGCIVHKALVVVGAKAGDERERFLGFVAFATSMLAVIALVLIALPPWFVVCNA